MPVPRSSLPSIPRTIGGGLIRRTMLGFLVLAVTSPLPAAVAINPLFGDHAILQSGADIPVWGTASEGSTITVRLAHQEARSVTVNGRWEVRFKDLKPSAVPGDLVASGDGTATSSDVLVGEVWLCSGQSNMDFTMGAVVPADRDEAKAHPLPHLRSFVIKKVVATSPNSTVEGQWRIASGNDIASFSAVGYYFGRAIHRERKAPVGLIGAHWGGTLAEAWTSDEALKSQPVLTQIFKRQEQDAAAYPKALADYQAAKAAGKTEAREPVDPATNKNGPSRLFNGMIHPLIPVALRGFLWYQGEGNKMRPLQYQTLLPAMITDWRQRWGRGDLPFFLVQIAPYEGMTPEIREAQMTISDQVTNAGIVCTVDVGEEKDIHPKNKRPVGERLALLARKRVYGESVVDSGPRYAGMSVAGHAVTVTFQHTDGGLVATGGTLLGFSLAGEDKRFVPATAVIQGDAVVVTAQGISSPVAVRYAWAGFPVATLANGAGLPAFPFRSDAWPTDITH